MGKSETKSSEWGFFPWLATTAIIALIALAIGFVILQQMHLLPGGMSQENSCINNLHQIDGAKQEWALENGKTNGAVCTVEDIKPYIKLNAKGDIPSCPQGGIYAIGKVGERPTCSLGKTNHHVLP